MPSFADLAFHVLAHAPIDAAASAWDPTYVAWSAARLGPASERALGEDARALAATLGSHEALVRAQLLAWLFDEDVRASSHFERALSELAPSDVDAHGAPDVLAYVAGDRGAELLWCAIALEAEHHARLPPVSPASIAALAEALDVVRPAAPALDRFDVRVVRSLRLRGRVRGREIWVGAPDPELGPSAEHAAWQAAHEATVAEIEEREPSLGFEDLELAAVRLLDERAADVGQAGAHARWLSGLRVPNLARG